VDQLLSKTKKIKWTSTSWSRGKKKNMSWVWKFWVWAYRKKVNENLFVSVF